MRYLAIIPARGGSKGIPRKNIIDINGRPLIDFSIQTGLECVKKGYINRLIVSTDDEEIAAVSRQCGAEVPFLRPAELSGDKAKSVDAVKHAISYLEDEKEFYDAIILLQPTSPLRTSEDIRAAIEIFEKQNCSSLISCYKEEYICDLVTYYKEGNMAVPLNPNHNKGIRRQELKELYVRNGSIYITDTNTIIKQSLIIGDNPAMYVMPKNRSVNVDTFEDLELLRWMTLK